MNNDIELEPVGWVSKYWKADGRTKTVIPGGGVDEKVCNIQA